LNNKKEDKMVKEITVVIDSKLSDNLRYRFSIKNEDEDNIYACLYQLNGDFEELIATFYANEFLDAIYFIKKAYENNDL
jgi:hypothetical protein